MKLKGKTFIITGATSGMGKAISREFSREGANLILSGRNEESGNRLVEEFQGQAIFLAGDVGGKDYNRELVNAAIQKFGHLDGISINAGTLGLGNIEDVSFEVWSETFRTNLDAVFYLLKYALPEMKNRPSASVIINSSIAAFKSFPNHPAYCASKAALVALSKQAAVDYGPTVRINCICPGPVDTPLIHASAEAFPDPSKAVEDAGKSTLLKRLGQPEDIAKLALFLASNDSSWITGAVYVIDGGILAKG